MIKQIDEEINISVVKELAKVLFSSNIILQDEIKKLKGQMSDHDQMRLDLSDKLSILRKRFFEKGTERLSNYRPSKSDKDLLPHNRPPLDVLGEYISEQEKTEIIHEACSCPKCGDQKITKIKGQFEESSEIDVIERTIVEKLHKRQKYRCKGCESIVSAVGQEKLRAGAKYSIDFAVNVAVDKFSYHLPLERIERQLNEIGVKVDSKQLYSLTEMLYLNLEPVAEKIRNELLGYGYINIDETGGKILKTNTNGFIWSLTNKYGAYFQFETTRSGKVAEEMLKGFSGTIINDGFSGYNRFSKDYESKIRVANCWAHVRRKFFDCMEDSPIAEEFLVLVSRLYKIEHGAKDFDDLKILREDKSYQIINEIRQWLEFHDGRYLRGQALGKAIKYTLTLWDGLIRFLSDPKIPLDNNAAERSLRNPVKGRDNYNGFMSINGADTAMFFYTIVETCKILKINPRVYLSEMARSQWRKEELLTPYEFAKSLMGRPQS